MKEFYRHFQHIECENNLFDIKDSKGTTIWETIRFSAYTQISQGREYLKTLPHSKSRILINLIDLIHFFIYIYFNRHKRILIISCSRDKKDGYNYDKILDSSIKSIGMDRCLILDSYSRRNIYKGNCASTICCGIFERFIKPQNDIESFIEKVKNAFSEYTFDIEEFKSSYKAFYGQYYFYLLLFRYLNIKKIILVQNGIQKGLMRVANERGIELIEYQHGQFSKAHPAYSYPHDSTLKEKIYVPDIFFTFGLFWNNISFIPGCKFVTLGNDAFALASKVVDVNKNKDILVVSSMIHGDLLSEFVLSLSNERPDIHFYFKLHPNEYHKLSYYNNKLKDAKNVEVITNEKKCSSLLQKVAYILVIQSTVEFEALSQGVKVIVLQKLDFNALSCLFNEEGIFRIHGKDDFFEIYDKHFNEIIKPRDDFFVKYNEAIVKELILK